MLEDLKQELTLIAKKAELEGLCKHKAGNFSIKDPKSGLILVTPSGIARSKLTYEDICVTDMNANVIERKDNLKPTSELLMHLYAYKTRPDINAVAHTHSRFATSFAVLNKPIPPIVYEAAYYCGMVPVAPYARPGTVELAESIVEPLRQGDTCLLQHHGVIALGKDLETAYLNAHYVEEVAEIYYRALLINHGQEPPVLPQEELQKWEYPSYIKL